MSDFSIGLSGLSAAQKAMDTIANNVANAATEGYHRQRINLAPAYGSQSNTILLGGGVDVDGISRMIDNLLEQEILRQQSLLDQTSQEYVTLRTIESQFGELSSDEAGLSAAIDKFFVALQDFAAHPGQQVWQSQVITAAEVLASQFRTLGNSLSALENQISLEASNSIARANTLFAQIAELNENIQRMEVGGSQANNLRDQRDQRINELSSIISVQTISREYGVVDVEAAGLPVVVGAQVSELELGMLENGLTGICIKDSYSYNANIEGGKLGGLLSLKNQIVNDIHTSLDTLAATFIQQINQYHLQGVGTAGSFTELNGWAVESEELVDFSSSVTDGIIHIRLTNTLTGDITRHEIAVDKSEDSLTDIASRISAVAGLSASVISSKLNITADTNYKFDFLPGVLAEPTTSNLVPDVTVSGIYTGSENQTYTCTVVGSGDISNDDSLQIQVKIGATIVKNINVGSGYAAGDRIEIDEGIFISLEAGTLADGQIFTVEALANSDTSGLLASLGINTFFEGSSASDISVADDIAADPKRIAASISPSMTDSENAKKLAALKDDTLACLSGRTIGDFYRQLITDIGDQISIKQTRQENITVIVKNLSDQQGQVSGVNINDEAAQLMVYEQMFQAMAKYMTTLQTSYAAIFDLIQ